ncbi:diacylglycerol kinase family lipid kinase [Peribacillus cavernae]|uniref:Diacylglycerol kinase family lipid kinase n=1 Tax=Peribacillus cavernae TaxID=1674310 RepID=A0A433HKU7_9BACI|nr:diacylglycerol kinase family protein [Peribacillus cavernae]MDQ0220228.1 YegS/Rv2252/BmrU family lipid kinase [Peribacillus cavernae]RUQ28845.1 diacylglycerol kinase family lipid kinase [Peribacillus cavernae]
MTKAMIILNPSSGKEKGLEILPVLKKVVSGLYDETVIRETAKEGDAAEFARESCAQQFDAVFSMGGDGTISETINGLAEQSHRPDLGIIPLGTVNDFARALKIPLEPENALELLSEKHTVPVDIGKINDCYFMNVLAVGAIAEASYAVSAEQKTMLGSFAYFIEGIKAFINKTPFNLTVEHDGGKWIGQAYMMVSALTNSVGGFESLAPQAEVNDGKIHTFIIKDISFPQIMKIIPRLLKGELERHDKVEYICSSSIGVSASEELVVNIDGDEGEPLPFQVKVLPQHLNVFVPV